MAAPNPAFSASAPNCARASSSCPLIGPRGRRLRLPIGLPAGFARPCRSPMGQLTGPALRRWLLARLSLYGVDFDKESVRVGGADNGSPWDQEPREGPVQAAVAPPNYHPVRAASLDLRCGPSFPVIDHCVTPDTEWAAAALKGRGRGEVTPAPPQPGTAQTVPAGHYGRQHMQVQQHMQIQGRLTSEAITDVSRRVCCSHRRSALPSRQAHSNHTLIALGSVAFTRSACSSPSRRVAPQPAYRRSSRGPGPTWPRCHRPEGRADDHPERPADPAV
jgi:hypothetical protein